MIYKDYNHDSRSFQTKTQLADQWLEELIIFYLRVQIDDSAIIGPKYTEHNCNYTLKNSVTNNFFRVIATFRGRHSVYEQKNSSSLNYVPITVKLYLESNSSRLFNFHDNITKRCGEIRN